MHLLDYPVNQVRDVSYYGRVVYNDKIEVNVERAIPMWRKLIALIHEGLHVINPGWTHVQLHNLAVAIMSHPNETAENISLATKCFITDKKLKLIKQFVKKNFHKLTLD